MENNENEQENESKEENKVTVDEGPRMRQLRQALTLTVSKIISSARYSVFRENFKPIHEKNPKCLAKLHEQMTAQLQHSMTEEIEEMFQEENIVNLMNDLDKLIDKCSHRVPTWRPSGNPDLDIIAHTMNERQNQRNYLKEIVKELESRNRMLTKKYEKKKASLLEVQNEIEVQVSKLGYEIADAKAKIPCEDMKKFLNQCH